jgi:hypothetical protein
MRRAYGIGVYPEIATATSKHPAKSARCEHVCARFTTDDICIAHSGVQFRTSRDPITKLNQRVPTLGRFMDAERGRNAGLWPAQERSRIEIGLERVENAVPWAFAVNGRRDRDQVPEPGVQVRVLPGAPLHPLYPPISSTGC